tara:strand:- start:157 stop:420 length:264 start_codon:yes stop_codon:yes gene_type:complete
LWYKPTGATGEWFKNTITTQLQIQLTWQFLFLQEKSEFLEGITLICFARSIDIFHKLYYLTTTGQSIVIFTWVIIYLEPKKIIFIIL